MQDRQDRRAGAGRVVVPGSGAGDLAADPELRREREIARWRLHLVKHRTTLKNRVHATLITFGHPCPISDLFGLAGRELLDELEIPDPWRSHVDASLVLIDDLEACRSLRSTSELRRRAPITATSRC